MHFSTVRYCTVLFDLDGTLVDSRELILRSYRYALDYVLHFQPPDEELTRDIGIPLPEAMRNFVRQVGVPPSATEEHVVDELLHLFRAYHKRYHDAYVRPFPSIAEVLAQVQRQGVLLGVVSSKSRDGIAQTLQLFDLEKYFLTYVGLEDTDQHKPGPEPLLEAMRRLGGQPACTVYVGDSPFDIQAAKAAGIASAAALWGYFPAEVRTLNPDYLLQEPGDVLALLAPGPR